MLHHEENDHQKGLELVSRAVELCPGNSVLLNSRAVIEMGLGRFAVAAVTLREAVDIDPANAEAQRNLGVVLRALGRIDDAWRQFNRAVELDPANGKNYLDLGEIAESRQEWWDAETLFRQAIENSCVDAGSVALGRLLNELDRSAEARDFLLGVEDSCYEHFEWNLQTGVAFGKLNRHRRGRRIFAKVRRDRVGFGRREPAAFHWVDVSGAARRECSVCSGRQRALRLARMSVAFGDRAGSIRTLRRCPSNLAGDVG